MKNLFSVLLVLALSFAVGPPLTAQVVDDDVGITYVYDVQSDYALQVDAQLNALGYDLHYPQAEQLIYTEPALVYFTVESPFYSDIGSTDTRRPVFETNIQCNNDFNFRSIGSTSGGLPLRW